MDIEKDIINPSVKEEISSFLTSRRKWRCVGICMETTSKIMVGITSILSFTTSIYPCNTYLSFSSGTIATLSLVSLQFANYAFKESKLSTDNLNKLLTKLDITTLPDLNGSVLKSPTNENIKIDEL